MNKLLNSRVGEMKYDGLIVDNIPVADVASILLTAGTGVIKRGCVIAGIPGAEVTILSAAAIITQSLFILADDTDTGTTAGDAIPGIGYRTGHFNRQALLVADSYELTAADEELLRKGGIILSDALNY